MPTRLEVSVRKFWEYQKVETSRNLRIAEISSALEIYATDNSCENSFTLAGVPRPDWNFTM